MFRLDITETFHQTDKALDTLNVWRIIEGHNIFSSKIRFQIRLVDFRLVLIHYSNSIMYVHLTLLNLLLHLLYHHFFRCTYDSQFCTTDQADKLSKKSLRLAVHEIQGFYNFATTTLLDQLSKEIQKTNGTKTWRYHNL